MEVYKYEGYEDYRQAQIEANERKLDCVWAHEDQIRQLCAYLTTNVSPLEFGLCHGSRTGAEQSWFRQHLGIEVIGTEIAPSANERPHTIQWDFHEVKQEWLGAVDFIFSNSFDHTYDPELCLRRWMSCLRPTGVCIIEWTGDDAKARRSDPLGATREEYETLFESGPYRIADCLLIHGRADGTTAFKSHRERHCYIVRHAT